MVIAIPPGERIAAPAAGVNESPDPWERVLTYRVLEREYRSDLVATIRAAHQDGWSTQVIADAAGFTRGEVLKYCMAPRPRGRPTVASLHRVQQTACAFHLVENHLEEWQRRARRSRPSSRP